jgi:hypothetical protein
MAGAIGAASWPLLVNAKRPGELAQIFLRAYAFERLPGTHGFLANGETYKMAGWRSGLAGASPPRVGELAPRNLRQNGVTVYQALAAFSASLSPCAQPHQSRRFELRSR